MPALRPGAARAMQFFGSILAGAFAGQGTADIWNNIRSAASDAGVNLGDLGISGADISQLRGYAGAIARSADTLNTMAGDLGIPDTAIALAPWSQGDVGQFLAPSFQVRYLLSATQPDGTVTADWRTLVVDSLPATVGDLRDIIDSEGAFRAEDYGLGFVGTSGIHVIAG